MGRSLAKTILEETLISKCKVMAAHTNFNSGYSSNRMSRRVMVVLADLNG